MWMTALSAVNLIAATSSVALACSLFLSVASGSEPDTAAPTASLSATLDGAGNESSWLVEGQRPDEEVLSDGGFFYIVRNGFALVVTSQPDEEIVVPSELGGHEVVSVLGLSLGADARTLRLPATVRDVNARALFGLESIEVDPANQFLESVDGVLFNRTTTALVSYPNKKQAGSYSVPKGTLAIGDWAFDGARALETIEIPDSVLSIGAGAFHGCGSLKTVEIPAKTSSIGAGAFFAASSLEAIEVDPANEAYESREGVLFDRRAAALVCYPENREGAEYTVPNGTLVIGDIAFLASPRLERVVLPEGLVALGDWAFYGLPRLAELEVPASVESIGECALCSCPEGAIVAGEGTYAQTWLDAESERHATIIGG